MKGFENQTWLIGWIISNIVALVLVLTAWEWPRLTRLLFFLLFAWASWINWKTAIYSPADYQDYAHLAILDWYKGFIQGWFKEHTLLLVGSIACCQAIIAVGMLFRGWVLKLGLIAGIVFLLAIVPLGIGSGLPCTLNMAIALLIIHNKRANDHIWIKQPVFKKQLVPGTF